MRTKLVIVQYLVDVDAGMSNFDILEEALVNGDMVELEIEDVDLGQEEEEDA